MPIVFYEEETSTRAKVTLIHHQPDLLDEERRAEGIEVESIPKKESRKGKTGVLYINPENKELWYEYIDRPLNTEEITEEYQNEIDAIRKSAQIATRDKIKADELSDDELLSLVKVYSDWDVGIDYVVGDLVNYHNKLWEVIQDHTSQADWAPDVASSLFTEKTPEGVITEWKQPTGAHDAYNTGDQVLYNDETYESIIDDNVWNPEEYPEGWNEI